MGSLARFWRRDPLFLEGFSSFTSSLAPPDSVSVGRGLAGIAVGVMGTELLATEAGVVGEMLVGVFGADCNRFGTELGNPSYEQRSGAFLADLRNTQWKTKSSTHKFDCTEWAVNITAAVAHHIFDQCQAGLVHWNGPTCQMHTLFKTNQFYTYKHCQSTHTCLTKMTSGCNRRTLRANIGHLLFSNMMYRIDPGRFRSFSVRP